MSALVPEGFPKVKGTEPGAPKCATTGDLKRNCKCRPCIGRRSQSSGKRKQRAARKALEQVTGTHAARFLGQLGNEESWTGLPLRVEVKSGAIAGPVWTKYAAAEAQAAAAKAIGDTRPFVFIAMGQRTPDGLLVCRLSELARVVEALVNQ
jgi:hypothetical protein